MSTNNEFLTKFSSLPIQDQMNILEDFKKTLESDSTYTESDLDKYLEKLQKYKATYTTDEKEEENKNDFNITDLQNQFKVDLYKNLKQDLSAKVDNTYVSPEPNKGIDLGDKIQQGIGAVEKGLRGVPVSVASWLEALASGYVTLPLGSKLGDDKNNKWSQIKEDGTALWKGFVEDNIGNAFGGAYSDEKKEEMRQLWRDSGFPVNKYDDYGFMFGSNNAVLFNEPKEDQWERIERLGINNITDNAEAFFMANPITVDSWDDIEPTYINMIAEAIPNLAVQIGASYVNPIAGMAYASQLTLGDQYELAKPYIEDGTISTQEAFKISQYVAGASAIWNYLPARFYHNAFKVGARKEFERRIFNHIYKNKLYGDVGTSTLVSGLTEGIQEAGDAVTSLYGESQYREVTGEEYAENAFTAGMVGIPLGFIGGASIRGLTAKDRKKAYDQLIEYENFLLPKNMTIDKDGIKLNLDRKNFESDEEYNAVKKQYEEIIRKIDPEKLANENPDIPPNLLIFDYVFRNNPMFKDSNVEFSSPLTTSIMTYEQLKELGYDPENVRWDQSQIKEGDPNYEEGQKKYKVWTLGSNILTDTGGSVVLSQGSTQDVYVEEVVELLYKKLETENPELKQRIDRWIELTSGVLDESNVGGPRGLELFSKFYTFNYLGYADTEFDLADIAMMPQDIRQQFNEYMGQQEDGTNLSFLFQGDIDKTLQLNVKKDQKVDETQETTEEIVEETTEPIETKVVEEGESFRLEPEQLDNVMPFLEKALAEGMDNAMWYEATTDAVLGLTGGDVDEANKILALMAVTSANTAVKGNLMYGIKAYYQYKNGERILSGQFPNMNEEKLTKIMNGELTVDEIANNLGPKVGSFFKNLSNSLNNADPDAVTIDIWMMRAFGFDKDTPTDLEYRQTREIIQKLAKENNLTPYQAQASIWTYTRALWNDMKPEMMEYAIEKGWYTKKDGWTSKEAEQQWRKEFFKRMKTGTIDEIESANFIDYLKDFSGNISLETLPHISTKIFDNNNLTNEQKLEYDVAIRKLLTNENGKDKIAELVGLLELGIFNAPGFFEGGSDPSSQLEVLMSSRGIKLNQETKDLIKVYASIYGKLTNQWAVGFHKVFPANNVSGKVYKENVSMVGLSNIKGEIPYEQIYKDLLAEGFDTGAIPTEFGLKFVNFPIDFEWLSEQGKYEKELKILEENGIENTQDFLTLWANPKDSKGDMNVKDLKALIGVDKYKQILNEIKLKVNNVGFKEAVERVVNKNLDNIADIDIFKYGISDGFLVENNWEENTNGESYQENIDKSERSVAINEFIDRTSNEISQINENFKNKWEGKESFRLEPVDPDELTPEIVESLSFDEQINVVLNEEDPLPEKPQQKSFRDKANSVITEIDRTIRPISSILKDINPILKEALREYEFKVHKKTRDRKEVVSNFYNSDNYKNMSDADKHKLDLAFKNSASEYITQIIEDNNLTQEYADLRTMLEEIYKEGVTAGYEIGYLEDYIPRQFSNREAYLEEQQNVDPEFNTKIQQAIKIKEEELGRPLEVDEVESIIDMTLRGFDTLNGGRPTNIKQRKIQVVNNELNQYYMHSSEALIKYIDAVTNGIEKRVFLGQTDTDGNFSDYVRQVGEEYGLTTEQEEMITEVLQARFGKTEYNNVVPVIKNITYGLTMGSPISAVTQLGDLVWSYKEAGVLGTWGAMLGKKTITIEDLGIDRIGQEFETKDLSAKGVKAIFDLVQITRIDRLGKETLINSVYNKYQKEAKSGNLSENFVKDLDSFFGSKDQAVRDQLIQDLADGNITEDVQLLLFNKLLDHQPTADSEMPMRYLRSPGGRLFYQLKTFTLKQMDVTRNVIMDEIVNAKDNKSRIAGTQKFIKLLTMWMLAGIPKDIIKDMILGRPIDTDLIPWENDYVIENLMQFAGASRYQIYVGKTDGLDAFLNKFIAMPGLSVGAETVEDVFSLRSGDDVVSRQRVENMTAEEYEQFMMDKQIEDYMSVIARIPVAGKVYFWRSEHGQNKIINFELKKYQKIYNKRPLTDNEKTKYTDWLMEALNEGIITKATFDRRMNNINK